MRKYWIFLGVAFLLAVAMVLYLLLRPGDDPGAEQELTEEMQTPRVPRADRGGAVSTDSAAQANGELEIFGNGCLKMKRKKHDIQGAASVRSKRQRFLQKSPRLHLYSRSGMTHRKRASLEKAGPILLDLRQLETLRHQFELDPEFAMGIRFHSPQPPKI